ncbi:AAA domain-containing protein [Candidatus Woesearchaeota archaeon]|nr:AAA domain-containing protein [Candidatus Woesearchaeota archaeon]
MKLNTLENIMSVLPASRRVKAKLYQIEQYFEKDEQKKLRKLLKTKKLGVSYTSLGISKSILTESDYPRLHLNLEKGEDKEIKKFIERANKVIEEKAKEVMFKRFSIKADKVIPKLVSPNITGMDTVKLAAALQLFSTEKIHLLLLGDPGTGKTEILRSLSEMAPISSFGLGSGTSHAGLSITMKGNEVIKGLLPQANGGLCCIDELNLMKQQDRASLYSAMEKGIVTYDKGKHHLTEDARINVLATANPKGDKFAGWMINTLKNQLPFEQALLTRFHLLFLIRKPNATQFEEIAKKIVTNQEAKQNKNDLNFVKEYVAFLKGFDVKFPKALEEQVVEFSKKLKSKENEFLVEISPRIVHGMLRLAKASAKMNMRPMVMMSDIAKVKQIFEESLKIKK